MSVSWRSAVIFLSLIYGVFSDCEVLVVEPWPMPYLFLPLNSTVEIHCTALSDEDTPFWAADLASDSKSVQFRAGDREFNANGLYALPAAGTPPTLRLLINDTAVNNQTVVYCNRDEKELSSTLFVYEPSPFTLEVVGMDTSSINVSWSQSPTLEVERSIAEHYDFSLTISYGSTIDTIFVNETNFYLFTAPDDAPPCQVYNFSVTATPVGATYTGGGCSAPSPVLSVVLPPPLPDTESITSSLQYSIAKRGDGRTILQVSFLQPLVCPAYKYSLLVYASSNETDWQKSFAATSSKSDIATLTADDLPDNAMMSFEILVSNGIDEASSGGSDIYTTDVQSVRVTYGEENESTTSTVIILCDFIAGSKARGCMVVLSGGKSDNIMVNLTREKACAELALEGVDLTSTAGVVGFDIEADGSVGSLPVPGAVVAAKDKSELSCQPMIRDLVPTPSLNNSWIIGIAAGISTIIIIVLVSTALILVIVRCRLKRSQTASLSPCQSPTLTKFFRKGSFGNTNDCQENGMDIYDHIDRQSPTTKSPSPDQKCNREGAAMSYYDIPQNVCPERQTETANGTVTHKLQVSPTLHNTSANETYAKLEDSDREHHYHVLEGTAPIGHTHSPALPPWPNGPSHSQQQSPDLSPPVIYQEVSNFQTSCHEAATTIQPSFEQLSDPETSSDDQTSPDKHVYQDIQELSLSHNVGGANGSLSRGFHNKLALTAKTTDV